MRLIKEFLLGFSSPFKGIELILSNRGLFWTAVLPFSITALIFILGLFFGFPLLAQLIPSLTLQSLLLIGVGNAGFWHSILYWVVVVLAWPAAIFALFYSLFLVTRLIATPFYAFLAERVLISRNLIEDRPFEMWDWVVTNWRLMGVALIKVFVFAIVGLVLFLLSFFPGFGLISAFGYLLMAAFDVVDISFEGMRLSFKERLSFFQNELPCFFGLASAMGLVFLVPGLNFFLFPAAVAGASEIIKHRSGRGRLV